MNLLARCIYALFFMGFSIMLNASAEPNVSIRYQKNQSFSLHLEGMQEENYHIELSNQNGFVFINEKVEGQNDYLKIFNLKQLSTGNYTLKLENEQQIILQKIEVRQQELIIDATTKRILYKPNIVYQFPYLDLKMMSNEGGIVTIKDKHTNVLYKKKIAKNDTILKRFNIADLPTGTHIVEIETASYTYEQTFFISAENKVEPNKRQEGQVVASKKSTGAAIVPTYQIPYLTNDIMNRIKWLQTQRN